MVFLSAASASAQSVVLDERDAEVWGAGQVVDGRVEGVTGGRLFVNDSAVDFEAEGGAFAVPVELSEGVNALVACSADGAVCSDTVRWTLGYERRPEVYAWATVEGRVVRLHARVLENPDGTPLNFRWEADPDNPAPLDVVGSADTAAVTTIPESAPEGEYYFDLAVTEAGADGDTFPARTFVTAHADGLTAFDIETDHAAWVDRAVVYEIFPRLFMGSFNGKLRYVTDALPELVRLGVDTIWLQPIFPYGAAPQAAQAYDVTDYFHVWSALGPEEDLRTLVDAAHEAGLRVMLDFVPNHSSIEHPYARDAIAHGAASYYYDFYMRERDQAPYAKHYNILREGEMTFVYYFWDDLMTFDFDNPDVQRFIIEASRHWVEAFDVDGFRLDAVWGPHSRNPAFTREWRLALKRMKPEVFLLAEDKAPYSEAFVPTDHPSIFESFDAAYDWTDDEDYLSEWAYQSGFDRASTIFNNLHEVLRSERLRRALTNQGRGFHPDAKILRFIENNDTPRFVAGHSVAQTKMAATLMFSLHGIPMMYYGQEAGEDAAYPSYPLHRTIASYDAEGFFPFYQHLIRLRKTFPALYGDRFAEVPVGPANEARYVFAYRRWEGEENVFGVVNTSDRPADVTLALPVDELAPDPDETYYLTDLFTGAALARRGDELASVPLSVDAHTTALYALADRVVPLPVAAEPPPRGPLPAESALEPNYPNPFAGETVVPFTLSRGGAVRLVVHDLLGREVALLADGWRGPGRHEVVFDAGALPGGLYFVRLEHEGRQSVRPLLHVGATAGDAN